MPSKTGIHTLTFLTALLVFGPLGQAAAQDSPEQSFSEAERNALAAVARRIDGYNEHDLAAYLSAHHEDVQIYEYPDKLIGRGRVHIERIFGPLLEQGLGHITVKHQTVVANTVISEEYVSFGGPGVQHIVVLYTIADGLIESFRLVEAPD